MFLFTKYLFKYSPILSNPTIRNFSHFVNRAVNPSTLLSGKCSHLLTQCCGFKVMGKVRRRCKDCFLVKREERWYVLCKTHGRHKQMQIAKDPKNTWILSHATQSKVRPW